MPEPLSLDRAIKMLEERVPHPATRWFIIIVLVLIILAAAMGALAVIVKSAETILSFADQRRPEGYAGEAISGTESDKVEQSGAASDESPPPTVPIKRKRPLPGPSPKSNPGQQHAGDSYTVGTAIQSAIGPGAQVTNFGPPPPHVETVSGVQFVGKDGNGSHQWAYMFRVVGSPDGVRVTVRGNTIKDASINPLDQGTAQYGTRPATGVVYLTISAPRGRYQVVVNTADDTIPEIEAIINH